MGGALERALGVHRVLEPAGVLAQAAQRLDADPSIGPDEVRISVQRLNLDAASFRQLSESCGGDGEAVRAAVLEIVGARGKMQNPVTGSGGMLIGVVDAVGPESPLGLVEGQRVATLVSLTLTPLRITDGLQRWDGRSEQVPAAGTAVLFARSIAAVLPDDLPDAVSLAVLDVCGAPAATARVVERTGARSVAVLGAAGKSGCLSLAAARAAGAAELTGLVRNETEAAALGAEGMAADVTMLVGNGYTPGHAALALDLYRSTPGVRALIDPRVHA
jgi:L-erythro-3,5-diaminohexanoate dehydrogenase